MDLTMKELRLHTLRGDIQQIGMESTYNKNGIRNILEKRYVNGTEIPVTQAEFDSVLDEEYKKIEAWRLKQPKTEGATRADLWNRANENANLFFNLWERWQDEQQYEDINDYLKHLQQTFPEAYAITKRPFGIKCKADDGNIHLTVKRSGNKIKLCGQHI